MLRYNGESDCLVTTLAVLKIWHFAFNLLHSHLLAVRRMQLSHKLC